ncbi:MAG: response regulator [Candidatus Woesearchaeota archaeon]
MGIEQKLTEHGITNLLVVDDTPANLDAARTAFQKYNALVNVDYASSAQEALQKIQAAKVQGKKYDLVISDLSMETPLAGLDVIKAALLSFSYATIATGANYDKPCHGYHGPTTTVRPLGVSFPEKKDTSETWDFVLEKSLEYLTYYKQTPEFAALNRYQTSITPTSNSTLTLPEHLVRALLVKYQ